MSWSMFNNDGQRKYISIAERDRFLDAAKALDKPAYLLCRFVAASGVRISEALSLTPGNFDFDSGVVVIECLKKRRLGVFRAVPLPPDLLSSLRDWFAQGICEANQRIWPWARMTAYRHIRKAMEMAGLHGDKAAPKGLRHGFAVTAIQSGVPLNLVQRWLGHADMKTTAIYAAATGPEERTIAARMWNRRDDAPARPSSSSSRARPRKARKEANSKSRELSDENKIIYESEFVERLVEKLNSNKCDNILHPGADILGRIVVSRMLHFWLYCNDWQFDQTHPLAIFDTVDMSSTLHDKPDGRSEEKNERSTSDLEHSRTGSGPHEPKANAGRGNDVAAEAVRQCQITSDGRPESPTLRRASEAAVHSAAPWAGVSV